MRAVVVVAILITSAWPALAQQALPPGCTGPTRTATATNGKTITICLDRKYSTCMRDHKRLGHSHAFSKRDCDAKKAVGRVS